MISLYIDTTTSYPIIALIKDNEIISLYNQKIDGDISVSIFSILEDSFAKNTLIPNDIDNIYIVNGPGSFTGTRIGVTIAKVYAYTLNKRVIPISTLKAYATTKTNKKFNVSIIDARHNHVYAGIYDENLNNVFEDKYMNLDDLLKEIDDNYAIVTYDEFDFETIKPDIDILRIVRENTESVNPHSLNPNYCKLTEAEEKLNHD